MTQHTFHLESMIAIDAALASREGLRKPVMAKQLGRSQSYVQRYIRTLESLGCKTVAKVEGGKYLSKGSYYVHRYADRRRRVFSRWVSEQK